MLECSDPAYEVLHHGVFGPILTVYVYADGAYEQVLAQAATSPRTR